jgi:hypothetical protein
MLLPLRLQIDLERKEVSETNAEADVNEIIKAEGSPRPVNGPVQVAFHWINLGISSLPE